MTESRPASRRGTSNGNSSGSAEDRRRRKAWLLKTYASDNVAVRYDWRDALLFCSLETAQDIVKKHPTYEILPSCRCYRCGLDLVFETLTVDRIIPGCQGGTYRRNNIRPACSPCNEKTGGATRRKK